MSRQLMQPLRARDLWRQHRVKALPSKGRERFETGHPGRVKDPGKRRQRRFDLRQHACDVAEHGHITLNTADSCARCAKLVEHALRFRRRPATVEAHQFSRSALHEPASQCQPERAVASGNQKRFLRREDKRLGRHRRERRQAGNEPMLTAQRHEIIITAGQELIRQRDARPLRKMLNIDEATPVSRMFESERAGETHQRCRLEIQREGLTPCGDRVARDQP